MGFRPEIQALRALAVTVVVVFHLWPDALSGGYVGVDVFFVISGYLITGHLWSEVERTGTVSLPAFWSRRLRRLLPAAALVLVSSVLLMLLVVPRSLWQQTVIEVGASALWVQNWVLASNSVDYLAADGTPTLVQHFWSLSVEEQFYLVWPVLLLLAVLAFRARRAAVVGLLVALVVASFLFSVLQAEVASGYFNTATRAWEFGAGGLLALGPALLHRLRECTVIAGLASWAGFGMILASALLFTSATPFPGAAAALPVVGTVLVIAGGAAPATLLGRSVRLRGVQQVGDLSYSIYLWHWPLVVAGAYLPVGGEWWPLAALVLTLGLAGLTKRFVEDPARALRGTRRTYVLAVSVIAAIVVLSTTTWAVVQGGTMAAAQSALQQSEIDPCFGAAALAEDCAQPFAMSAAVDTAFAAQDRGVLWRKACNAYGSAVKTCEFGVTEGYGRTVAVVGNSHAAALIPGLDVYGKEHGWRVLLMRKTDCLGVSTLELGGSGGADCAAWTGNVLEELETRDDIDLVLFGSHANALHYLAAAKPSAQAVGQLEASIAETYRALLARGVRVLVVGDTPGTRPTPAPECIYLHRAETDPCSTDRGDGMTDDNLVATVARATAGVEYLSLTPYVCTTRCHALIGGVVVYFDDHHLSGTFARSLAPYLGRALEGR